MSEQPRRRMSILGDIFWAIAAVAIVWGGFAGFGWLQSLRVPVEPAPIERVVQSVETAPLTPFTDPLPVRGEGFIRADRALGIAAQVNGRIVELHPAIESLGRFAEGDVLFRLDDRAARASIARIEAELASTQARLDLNETQLRRVRTLRERGVASQDRLDQLESASTELRASLASIQANLQSAQVTLEDLTVTAPFAGAVLAQNAEIGSVVSPGQSVAEIYTADALEVVISLTEDEAALIPGLFSGEAAAAQVSARFAGRELVWAAEVSRVDAQLDTGTRTLNVAVRLLGGLPSVSDRLPSGTPPALLNTYANVMIEGAQPIDVIAVPSSAVRDGGQLWLEEDGRLAMRDAQIVHIDAETAFMQLPSISPTASLIVSSLDRPVHGMPVTVTNRTALAAAE